MDEFQEADILWPDTAPSQRGELLLVPSEILYELAASASSGGTAPSLFGRSDQGFTSTGAPSTACASSGADEEEWQEADVLWPDTVQTIDEPREGGVSGGFSEVLLHAPDGARSLPPSPGVRGGARPRRLPSTYPPNLLHAAASGGGGRWEPRGMFGLCGII